MFCDPNLKNFDKNDDIGSSASSLRASRYALSAGVRCSIGMKAVPLADGSTKRQKFVAKSGEESSVRLELPGIRR
jgi:hypothetical protein